MDGGQSVAKRHGAAAAAGAEEVPDRHNAPSRPADDDDDGDKKAPRPSSSRRVASLDVFRGLTVAVMILVDGAGGEWPVIGHAPWHGCNLADFVMPFFLFIVGMAIPLSLKRIPDRGRAVRRLVIRTLKLLFWGILLQGGYSHAPDELTYGVDMKHIRWCGILQRIALAYLLVAVIEIATKDARVQDQSSSGFFSIFRMYLSQWIVACCILLIYLSLVYGIYVPDWEFRVRNVDSPNYGKVLTVTCGTRGNLSPPCNAVGYIDRKILGINHLYQKPAWRRHRDCTDDSPHEGPFKRDAPAWCASPFEPEGLLSSFSAVLSTIIGVHYRHVLVHMKSHMDRLKQWVTMGVALLLLGIILHFSHGGRRAPALCLRAAAVGRHERDAGVRDGGGGHLRGLSQRLVLRRDQQHTGLLGEEARVRGGVALGQGGHPPLRPRRADPALGAPRRPPPPGRRLLEALAGQEDYCVIDHLFMCVGIVCKKTGNEKKRLKAHCVSKYTGEF